MQRRILASLRDDAYVSDLPSAPAVEPHRARFAAFLLAIPKLAATPPHGHRLAVVACFCQWQVALPPRNAERIQLVSHDRPLSRYREPAKELGLQRRGEAPLDNAVALRAMPRRHHGEGHTCSLHLETLMKRMLFAGPTTGLVDVLLGCPVEAKRPSTIARLPSSSEYSCGSPTFCSLCNSVRLPLSINSSASA